MDEHTSEISALKQQIEAECESMKQALDGRRGKTSHEAISKKYKRGWTKILAILCSKAICYILWRWMIKARGSLPRSASVSLLRT